MGNDYSVNEKVERPGKEKRRYSRFILGASLLLMVLLTSLCNDTEIKVEKLRIGNRLQGWTEKEGTYHHFDAVGLFDIINGGAPEYIDQGMLKGITQKIVVADSMTIELFAMDFGSPEKAHLMKLAKNRGVDSDGSDSSVLHGFVISRVIGGFWCYGAVGKFYFEITISGVDEMVTAREILEKLYTLYRSAVE